MLGLTHVGQRNHVLDGCPDSPWEGMTVFRSDNGHVPAHCNIAVPECIALPWANVPVQCTQWTANTCIHRHC